MEAHFELPTRGQHAHAGAKGVSELAAEYATDPRKAAALSRARAKLSTKLKAVSALSLAQLRLEKGLSQSKLGELMGGVAQPQVARIERGDDVKISTVQKLASALGLSAEQVFSAILVTRSARGDEGC